MTDSTDAADYSPDNFTADQVDAQDTGEKSVNGAMSPATTAALERDCARWAATVSGPLERAAAEDAATADLLAAIAAEDAATARLLERITADQDAADAALFAALDDADSLSPELLAALDDAEAAPVCDGDDWSDWSTDGDDGAPGGDPR